MRLSDIRSATVLFEKYGGCVAPLQKKKCTVDWLVGCFGFNGPPETVF